ncbi:MAG: ATP-dependent RecD-like DNA helicase [Oscillospiraceae bacterium]|jgi:exodeoxyribonuclease V alpha subunit|nr:ATP-dependent RecD-like DNA helicase [Oscillospiraceae bacterium]
MEQKENFIEIPGTVTAILFQNEENGYTVIKMETQDGGALVVVGCLPYVCPGEQLVVTGAFVKHTVHGEQFKAEWAERTMPEGAKAIFDFLASGVLKGVGPATATLIVSEFGADALKVLENEPEKLTHIRGISRRKAQELSEAYRRQAGIRRLLDFLSGYGIRPPVAVRLYRSFGERARALVEENPYIIAGERIGASFAEADAFALSLGFEGDCAERVAAAALYELWHNSRNGHSFIPADKLVSATAQLIEVGAEAVEEALVVLADSGEIVRVVIAEREACYLASFYEAELYTALRIREMALAGPEPREDIEPLIEGIKREQAVEYAALQRHALRIADASRIMVLTGGPGTGKTTTVRAIVSLFDKLGLRTLLTAPTGRAAKRMSELAGREASTVHRLLEAGFSPEGDTLVFKRNARDPLTCDAVILDECSMVDIFLMAALLRAMPPKCRLVMVGDADQLPSVGPGNVFLDIIRSGLVETVRLTEIFRQGAESRIVAGAHMINRGDYPDLRTNAAGGDFFFLRRPEASACAATVIELCTRRLPEKMGIPAADIQVLSPTRRGETGTRRLNARLQNALNPASPGKKEKKYGEIVFREGDRVMQIRNNYDIIWTSIGERPGHGTGIFNGDIGAVTAIDTENESMTVLFDDRLAAYGFDMLPELEHAFAMTVHKSQGSEFRAVIFAALEGPPQLMCRSVLYTAVTRAKELLILVGGDTAVLNMIDNHRVTRRYSGLRARLADQPPAF